MNMQRRFGMLTAIAGAALALGSLTFAGSATAVEQPSNHHDHTGNTTKCPTGTTQFNGQIKTGRGSTALFHWAVTDKAVTLDRSVEHETSPIGNFVTITQIDPTVTGLTAYLKGGHGYRAYSPVISGQQMQSPLNGGHNIPDLSHWFLCYTITPLVTTTTTIPEIVTTTTLPAPVYSYNLTSMCRPSETEGSLRIRNGSPTDQAYTLALYGGETLSGTSAPGDTLVTVPWSSSSDTWILTIDGQTKTKAIGNNSLCETTTTTTVVETTVIDTTTTVAETTTTTEPAAATTTTEQASEGPTTTLAATTTTEQASEGPTTTEQASEGPTTTVDDGALPTTGGGASLPLVLGLAMMLGGVLFTLLARTPRES